MPHTFWRGCKEDWGKGFTISPGEAGLGIYAMLKGASAMAAHYAPPGIDLVELTLCPQAEVVDLTRQWNMRALLAYARDRISSVSLQFKHYVIPRISANNIQVFGSIIEDFIRDTHPYAAAYIVPHKGPRIPTSKQVVIRKPEMIILKKLLK